jgi:hypothetical protein
MDYTFQDNGQSFNVVWEDDILTLVPANSSLTCEQFAAMMELTVDQLWAM